MTALLALVLAACGGASPSADPFGPGSATPVAGPTEGCPGDAAALPIAMEGVGTFDGPMPPLDTDGMFCVAEVGHGEVTHVSSDVGSVADRYQHHFTAHDQPAVRPDDVGAPNPDHEALVVTREGVAWRMDFRRRDGGFVDVTIVRQ
ncbi:MAG: hypothetical protein H6733_13435 [Alphaproteobacteria bacterium]|nr:hypothetical protein [Alphaproteobacteria bacterium]